MTTQADCVNWLQGALRTQLDRRSTPRDLPVVSADVAEQALANEKYTGWTMTHWAEGRKKVISVPNLFQMRVE